MISVKRRPPSQSMRLNQVGREANDGNLFIKHIERDEVIRYAVKRSVFFWLASGGGGGGLFETSQRWRRRGRQAEGFSSRNKGLRLFRSIAIAPYVFSLEDCQLAIDDSLRVTLVTTDEQFPLDFPLFIFPFVSPQAPKQQFTVSGCKHKHRWLSRKHRQATESSVSRKDRG